MRIESRNNTIQPQFGMHISKIGHQIDKVIMARGKVDSEVEKLRQLLEHYFEHQLKNDKFLGQGFFGKVYSIDDKYVFKCNNGEFPDAEIDTFKLMSKRDKKISSGLKTYFGNVIMKIGNIKILRNVSTTKKYLPAGIPRHLLSKHLSKDKLMSYYNDIYLARFANLPQKSFNAIANDFATLNKKKFSDGFCQFDTKNPNNIVLVGKSTLRIVDEMFNVQEKNPNSISRLLEGFLKKINSSELAPKTEENRVLRFELFKKIIIAGEKYNLPLLTNDTDISNLWHTTCDFGNKTGEEILQDLLKIRKEQNVQKRKKMINEYLNNL